MLARAAQYLEYEAEGEPAMFADADQFDTWAEEPIACVSALLCGPGGTPLMQGKAENRFAPRDPYTVEQAATTVLRLVKA